MAEVIGRLVDVGIGREVTRGTAVAPTYWLGKLDVDFEDVADMVMNESSYGVLNRNSDATITQQRAEGTLTGKVGLDSIGLVLYALTGSVSAVTATGETTHTFTESHAVNNPSLTVGMKDANQDLRFANAMLNSLELNFEVDNYFQFVADFISKKSATASNTVSHSAETEFSPHHVTVETAASIGSLGAGTAVEARSASITFDKTAVVKQIFGSKDVNDVLNTVTEITGTIEVYYEGTTYKDYVFNQTERALRIGVENTDVTLANSSNPHLFFDFDKVRFSNWSRSNTNDDLVMETFDFTALYDLSNAQSYSLELLNEVADYTA